MVVLSLAMRELAYPYAQLAFKHCLKYLPELATHSLHKWTCIGETFVFAAMDLCGYRRPDGSIARKHTIVKCELHVLTKNFWQFRCWVDYIAETIPPLEWDYCKFHTPSSFKNKYLRELIICREHDTITLTNWGDIYALV